MLQISQNRFTLKQFDSVVSMFSQRSKSIFAVPAPAVVAWSVVPGITNVNAHLPTTEQYPLASSFWVTIKDNSSNEVIQNRSVEVAAVSPIAAFVNLTPKTLYTVGVSPNISGELGPEDSKSVTTRKHLRQ